MQAAQRLDAALVARGLFASRTAARKAIEAGRVRVRKGGLTTAHIQTKPAALLEPTDEVTVQAADTDAWVSRGALKLLGAMETSGLNPTGAVALDVGQSTGGFTDVLLKQGATRVLGLDVGHGQLHASLRQDPRVRCLEGINARDLSRSRLLEALEKQRATDTTHHADGLSDWCPPTGYDLIVMDVSFISLLKLSAGLKTLLKPDGHGLWLVKPQFEVGPALIGKGGLVKPEALGPAFENHLCAALTTQGLHVRQFMPSPITGGDGNREFFVWVSPESA